MRPTNGQFAKMVLMNPHNNSKRAQSMNSGHVGKLSSSEGTVRSAKIPDTSPMGEGHKPLAGEPRGDDDLLESDAKMIPRNKELIC
jgi:hypothetical protein